MGFTAKAVILDAEAPIDVDKIEDLVLVKRILARRLKGRDSDVSIPAGQPDAFDAAPDRSERQE
jgi:hypothetical protein